MYSQNNQHNYDSFASSTSYSYTSTNGHSSGAEAKITADHGEIITKYTKKERMENEPSNPQQMFDVKYIFSRVRHGHYDDILNALQKGFSVDTRDNQGNTILLVTHPKMAIGSNCKIMPALWR